VRWNIDPYLLSLKVYGRGLRIDELDIIDASPQSAEKVASPALNDARAQERT